MIHERTNFTGKLTKYLDLRSRPQTRSVVYIESKGSFTAGNTAVYRKTFTTATLITVPHGLGKIPFVQVAFDNGDGSYEGDRHILYNIVHDSVDQLTITLGNSASGIVICLA